MAQQIMLIRKHFYNMNVWSHNKNFITHYSGIFYYLQCNIIDLFWGLLRYPLIAQWGGRDFQMITLGHGG